MVGSETDRVKVRHVVAGPLDLTLFTHSFLGLGQDSAQQLSFQTAQEKQIKPNAAAEDSFTQNVTHLSPMLRLWEMLNPSDVASILSQKYLICSC